MRLRSYIEEIDFPMLQQWLADKKVHAMWSAYRIEYPLNKENLREVLRKCADENQDSAYVFTDDRGEQVGFCVYNVNTTDNTGFLKFIVVNHKLRGKGYGSQMLKLAAKFAFEITSVSSVGLNVFDVNEPAMRCYEKLGFQKQFHEENALQFENEVWGRYRMILERE